MGDILIVDDERDIRELIADILEDEGFSARKVGTADDCMREVMTAPPNLLILDIWLKDSDMDGIDILKRVKKEYPNIPVVIISGHGNIEIAVAAIKQGAYDFIEKPFNIDQLLVVIKRAMETSRLRHENTSLRQKDRPSAQMLGGSPGFRTLVFQLEKLTKTNSRVMLTGPSGCGKELAARYIHNNSERAQAPFVVVNCASIETDKMDSVLFGHEDKNKSDSTGLLEQANGGTVYLDEVADMPLATQSKLLRVLVDQGFSRLGGVHTVKVDFRVISSTS
ncbi:MAG: sigma-54-dependent Fis family transcriptional regulator, partial [Rhodobacteraceae bacterium]|nr:sigma-54-dependent Fis family transcriptional regulator [Paracoccaceae bacterium]